ncbi:MAG: hypothetical protein WBC05_02890 [Sedimentisphaerales bacterium]
MAHEKDDNPYLHSRIRGEKEAARFSGFSKGQKAGKRYSPQVWLMACELCRQHFNMPSIHRILKDIFGEAPSVPAIKGYFHRYGIVFSTVGLKKYPRDKPELNGLAIDKYLDGRISISQEGGFCLVDRVVERDNVCNRKGRPPLPRPSTCRAGYVCNPDKYNALKIMKHVSERIGTDKVLMKWLITAVKYTVTQSDFWQVLVNEYFRCIVDGKIKNCNLQSLFSGLKPTLLPETKRYLKALKAQKKQIDKVFEMLEKEDSEYKNNLPEVTKIANQIHHKRKAGSKGVVNAVLSGQPSA